MSTDKKFRLIFTDRHGGVSVSPYDAFNLADHVGDNPEHVEQNRKRLAEVLDMPENRFVYMEQVHSANIAVVTEDLVGKGSIPVTDGLITQLKNTPLVVLTADCVPALMVDPVTETVAAVHAGRIGARNGIVAEAVDRMVELGAQPEDIQVVLGPAAGGDNYELPQDVVDDVESHLPGSATISNTGTPSVDIRTGIIQQLMSKGVQQIDADPRDTIEDRDFFSYRRATLEGTGDTGRQASIVWLEN